MIGAEQPTRAISTAELMTANPVQPQLVLIAPDEPTSQRFELASRHGRWQVVIVKRLGEAEHLIGAGNVLAIVMPTSDAVEDSLRRLSRGYPTVKMYVWGTGLSSESVARALLAGAADVLNSRMSDVEIFARVKRTGTPTQRAETAR